TWHKIEYTLATNVNELIRTRALERERTVILVENPMCSWPTVVRWTLQTPGNAKIASRVMIVMKKEPFCATRFQIVPEILLALRRSLECFLGGLSCNYNYEIVRTATRTTLATMSLKGITILLNVFKPTFHSLRGPFLLNPMLCLCATVPLANETR
ncbi:hypothetical protein L9F63_013844, partial [Diploptera punctata]